jgi:O-antigen/teichoic acid export membrane protein
MMLRGGLGVLALGVSYWVTRDLIVALAAVATTRVLVLWADRAMTAPLRSVEPAGPTLGRRLTLARVALPLGIASLLIGLNPNVPRYFVEASAGLAALGLFTAMAHFVVAGRMVVTAFSQAAFPQLAELHVAADRESLRRLLGRLAMVGAVPGALGLVLALAFGREVLVIIYGHEFAAGAVVFPWIMLVGAVLFAQTPFGYALIATQQLNVQTLLFGAVVAVNAVGCLLLVPGYGIMGATLAWLASVVAQFTMSLGLYWRYHLRRPVAVLETRDA